MATALATPEPRQIEMQDCSVEEEQRGQETQVPGPPASCDSGLTCEVLTHVTPECEPTWVQVFTETMKSRWSLDVS